MKGCVKQLRSYLLSCIYVCPVEDNLKYIVGYQILNFVKDIKKFVLFDFWSIVAVVRVIVRYAENLG